MANTDACFIHWDPEGSCRVHGGDWRRYYKDGLGGHIDGVNGGKC
ncbi:hypothetical protein [Kitasatospora sp. HPMI-4]